MQRFAEIARPHGYDVYVADYIRRDGLAESREALHTFVREQSLEGYRALHVFAFIAGAWSLNALLQERPLPNLRSLIYDRSPLQERAPAIAAQELSLPARILYGQVLFDLAQTPYPVPPPTGHLRLGLLIEAQASPLLRRYRAEAEAMGPISFAPQSFQQSFADAIYVDMHHDAMYIHFDALASELLHFFDHGVFSPAANRRPPDDPFAGSQR
ncbi:MAG: hypothetical protein K1X75_05955 [Leptospirales bacterium]|nr:hypothetical protein [Leptospirales bacterium]